MYSPTNQIKRIGNARNNRISKAMQLQKGNYYWFTGKVNRPKFAFSRHHMANRWPGCLHCVCSMRCNTLRKTFEKHQGQAFNREVRQSDQASNNGPCLASRWSRRPERWEKWGEWYPTFLHAKHHHQRGLRRAPSASRFQVTSGSEVAMII